MSIADRRRLDRSRPGGQATATRSHGVGIAAVALALSVVAAVASGTAGAAGVPRLAARAWHVQPTPTPPATEISGLSAVSCASASSCTAIGSSSRTLSSTTRVLAERWDGAHWTILPAPTPARTSDTMYGISCPSASWCMTVGSAYQLSTHHTTPLAETWNGKSWRVVAAPALGSRTQLNAVSCTSAAACEAVGLYDDAKGTTQALAEQWNGTSWAMQAAARPGSSSVLEGVSCTSRSNCVAVGSQSTHATHPLTEWWDGTQWTAVTAPVAPHATGGYLSAVSCTAPHTCTATGTNFRPGGVTLAERWNGATWRVQTTPNPPNWRSSFRSTELDGVSCTSATTCVASGEYAPGGNAAYFIERWNGATWRLETTPRPAGYLHGALLAVSCRASRCAAVGAYTRVSLLQSTLALGG